MGASIDVPFAVPGAIIAFRRQVRAFREAGHGQHHWGSRVHVDIAGFSADPHAKKLATIRGRNQTTGGSDSEATSRLVDIRLGQ